MDKLQQLENRIKDLEKWKTERERQQVTFPLDTRSIEVLNKYFMRILNDIIYIGGAAGREFTLYSGIQGDRKFTVQEDTYVRFTVNTSTDYITAEQSKYRFIENQDLYVTTSDTLPTGLLDGITYYVKNVSGNTFQLSTTPGGAAVNITSSGTGVQYIYFN